MRAPRAGRVAGASPSIPFGDYALLPAWPLRAPLAYASPVPHVPAAPAPRAALRALWACI
jgi:hypothetical protein